MNVYSDNRHSAVKFMLDQIIDIPNLLYMGGDFNIRDAEWDPSISSHPAAGQALVDLADPLLEMSVALKACSNVFAPGPDHITRRYLKSILADDICAFGILFLANSCITLRHWPRHFKELVSVIIPKPGKPAYDTPKAFQPIVLLNTLGKLIEKIIARLSDVL